MTLDPLPSDLFSRRLRQERERVRMSQAHLAEQMARLLGTNVDPTAVTRIEKQERAVRLDEAAAAAEALGVPLAALMGESLLHDDEATLQRHLVELATAFREWERQRLEINRLTYIIQTLSTQLGVPVGSGGLPDDVDAGRANDREGL